MSFWDNLKNFFSGKISDEEVAAHEWIMCPQCSVNITKEDLAGNNWVCPNCSTAIHYEDNKSENSQLD